MEFKDEKQRLERNNQTLGKTLIILQKMVDSFTSVNYNAWEKYRDAYEKERGYTIGVPLSMQSYVGSDLVIDFAYLALAAEEHKPFTREYWIRSQGVQCIHDEGDKEAHRIFRDILGKIRLSFDGMYFNDIEWFEDEDCKIENRLIKDGLLYERYY